MFLICGNKVLGLLICGIGIQPYQQDFAVSLLKQIFCRCFSGIGIVIGDKKSWQCWFLMHTHKGNPIAAEIGNKQRRKGNLCKKNYAVNMPVFQKCNVIFLHIGFIRIGTHQNRVSFFVHSLDDMVTFFSEIIILDTGHKNADTVRTFGTERLCIAVRCILVSTDAFFNQDPVFFGNFFVIEIFGNSCQGKTGISGNVFDGSFHVSSLLICAVLDNVQEFCYNYTKKYSWWTGE